MVNICTITLTLKISYLVWQKKKNYLCTSKASHHKIGDTLKKTVIKLWRLQRTRVAFCVKKELTFYIDMCLGFKNVDMHYVKLRGVYLF